MSVTMKSGSCAQVGGGPTGWLGMLFVSSSVERRSFEFLPTCWYAASRQLSRRQAQTVFFSQERPVTLTGLSGTSIVLYPALAFVTLPAYSTRTLYEYDDIILYYLYLRTNQREILFYELSNTVRTFDCTFPIESRARSCIPCDAGERRRASAHTHRTASSFRRGSIQRSARCRPTRSR